jgi:hypothetical protein
MASGRDDASHTRIFQSSHSELHQRRSRYFLNVRFSEYHRKWPAGLPEYDMEGGKIMGAEDSLELRQGKMGMRADAGAPPNAEAWVAESKVPAGGGKLSNPAARRKERIRQLQARLEREQNRDNAASRKERNGQLFVWGAMVEGVYRDGDAREREQLRRWAKRKLTDKRHLKRAENGFARIEDGAADMAKARGGPVDVL